MTVLKYQILFAFLTFRLICVYFIQSSFVPDEYWQSLEVSHKLMFGYGHITWEWSKKIRSCFYPFIFYTAYQVIPDNTFLIIFLPKMLQSVLSSVGDFFAYKFAKEYFGRNCGLWTAFNISTSWFLFYCSSRTLTNMAEASLTACALYFYPWPRRDKYRLSSKYIWLAGVSVVIRPTAIVTWFPLYVWHLLRERNLFLIIKNTFIAGFIILAAMLCIDKLCFEDWVFTSYNFFIFNWKNDIGAFYGSHNFLWYFFIGLPVVLGLQIIPFICGLLLPQLRQFYCLIFFILVIFSLPSHKEFRFLLPVLHLCMIINGFVMNELWRGRMSLCNVKISSTVVKIFSLLLILVNISCSLYMGLWHQRGVIDAAFYLSKTVTDDSSVLFLMPCHSTPYYSSVHLNTHVTGIFQMHWNYLHWVKKGTAHQTAWIICLCMLNTQNYIHKNITMRFLTCEPNFENDANYVEEAESFYADPHNWLSVNYESETASPLPSHIVMFDTMYPNISNFFTNHNYTKCYSTFHSHFPQGRVGKFVNIYCR